MTDIALTTIVIDGVQYKAQYEYTSQAVAAQFRSNLQVFVDLFNLKPITDSNGAVTQSVADQIDAGNYASLIQTAVANLKNLAQNGVISNVDPNDPASPLVKYYLSYEMARDVDLLFQSLKSTGTGDPGNLSNTQIKLWKDLAAQTGSIQSIISSLIDTSGAGNRSLQALTELVYIKTANDIIGDSLESLEEALSSTQTVLTTLTAMQNLRNNLTARSRVTFSSLFDYSPSGTNISQFTSQYTHLASQYFGQPIVPELTSNLARIVQARNSAGSAIFINLNTDGNNALHLISGFGTLSVPPPGQAQYPVFSAIPGPGFVSAVAGLIQLREKLRTQITEISAITPGSAANDPGSLLGTLKKVYSDLNKNLKISVLARTSSRTSTNASGLSVNISIPIYSTRPANFSDIANNQNQVFNGFRAWMLDNYNKKFGTSAGDPAQAGLFDKNITFAITAAQSLNDEQKEKVRRFLFVFEEYYKSASAILTKLTEIAQKIAQSIAR